MSADETSARERRELIGVCKAGLLQLRQQLRQYVVELHARDEDTDGLNRVLCDAVNEMCSKTIGLLPAVSLTDDSTAAEIGIVGGDSSSGQQMPLSHLSHEQLDIPSPSISTTDPLRPIDRVVKPEQQSSNDILWTPGPTEDQEPIYDDESAARHYDSTTEEAATASGFTSFIDSVAPSDEHGKSMSILAESEPYNDSHIQTPTTSSAFDQIEASAPTASAVSSIHTTSSSAIANDHLLRLSLSASNHLIKRKLNQKILQSRAVRPLTHSSSPSSTSPSESTYEKQLLRLSVCCNGRWQCPVDNCTASYAARTPQLLRHIRITHTKTAKKYKCPECPYVSQYDHDVRRHIGRLHKAIDQTQP